MSNSSQNSNQDKSQMFDYEADMARAAGRSGAGRPRGVPELDALPVRDNVYRRPPQQSAQRRSSKEFTYHRSGESSARRTAGRQQNSYGAYAPPSRDFAPGRRPQKRQKKGKGLKIAIVTVCVLLAVLVAATGVLALIAGGWLGEIDGTKTDAGVLPDEVKTNQVYPEYTGKGILYGLICGIDYSDMSDDPNASMPGFVPDPDKLMGGGTPQNRLGNTDMILYMMYNTQTNDLRLLQIPRDTFVGADLETGGTGKINGLYANSADPNNRMAPLAKCFSEQFKLPVDFYITVDMDALKELVAQPPGYIHMYIPVDLNDPEHGDGSVDIAQGWHDITADQIEYVLRNRYSTAYQQQGDIARMQTQLYFYSALFRRFKELSPSDLMMWMRVLLYRVNTDMDGTQLVGLAQKALGIEGSNITFARPSYGGSTYNGQSVVVLPAEAFADLLNEYFRPEGTIVPVEQLDVQQLELIESIGVGEASVRTMGDVQATEAPDGAAA